MTPQDPTAAGAGVSHRLGNPLCVRCWHLGLFLISDPREAGSINLSLQRRERRPGGLVEGHIAGGRTRI